MTLTLPTVPTPFRLAVFCTVAVADPKSEVVAFVLFSTASPSLNVYSLALTADLKVQAPVPSLKTLTEPLNVPLKFMSLLAFPTVRLPVIARVPLPLSAPNVNDD